MATDLSSLLREISHWPSYELFRLMSAIGHRLEDSEKLLSIKRHLRIGQKINYYVPEQDKEIKATIVKFMRNNVVVEDRETANTWHIPYYSIDLDSVAQDFHSARPVGLGKIKKMPTLEKIISPSVSIGDDVAFLDRHGKETYGKVVGLHDRAATVSCKGTYWRMAYEYLSRLDRNKIKKEQPEKELP